MGRSAVHGVPRSLARKLTRLRKTGEADGARQQEIGYHVVEEARGRGYATEAARACLTYGFRQTMALLICSIVDPRNIASRTVAARVHADCREFIKREQTFLLFYTMRDQFLTSGNV